MTATLARANWTKADCPDVEAVALEGALTAVSWADGYTSTYDGVWLRDNCDCAHCGAHSSGTRYQRFLDLAVDIAPVRISCTGRLVELTWPDGHRSSFDGWWLRQHAYHDCKAVAAQQPSPTRWTAQLAELPRVEYSCVTQDPNAQLRLYECVQQYGFVIVAGLGTDKSAILRLAADVGYLRETHYGRVYDIIVRDSPSLPAETTCAILPHTDEAYRSTPTGINMFHCLRTSDDGGGETTLADGLSIADQLAEVDPTAFDLLTRVPIRHERVVPNQRLRSDEPVFALDPHGDLQVLRLNERTMGGIAVVAPLMRQAYAALRTTFEIAYDSANTVQFLLEQGDALLMDNFRIVHGRTAFSGRRHLRQAQVMRDEFFAKRNALIDDLPPVCDSHDPRRRAGIGNQAAE